MPTLEKHASISRAHAWRAASAVLLAAVTSAANAMPNHLLVVTGDHTSGSLAEVALVPPWPSAVNLATVGPFAVARHAYGLHYIVNPSPVDDIQVIDPETWQTLQRIPTGAGSDPRDILVAGPSKAYVSLHGRAYLLVIELPSGAAADSIDLSPLADADGLPEAARIASDGQRLFVQLQRLDGVNGGPVAPSLLAVIDRATDTLVDVDPAEPGIQGIRLTGLWPVNDMQIEGSRLYVMEQGPLEFIDLEGGVDEIDLVSLRALGFVTTEFQLGGHTNAFVMVSPSKGYAVTHTDLVLSSHLTAFARTDGSWLEAVYEQAGSWTDQLAFDAATGWIYFPDNAPGTAGIHVIDAASGNDLTPAGIPTGLPPRDVLVVRTTTSDARANPWHGPVLAAPQPNPFRDRTVLEIIGVQGRPVRIAIYDVAGRRVRELVPQQSSGPQAVVWDGLDAAGHPVAPGVYVATLPSASISSSQRVIRVR